MRKIIFMATLALLTAACQNNQKQDKTPITKPEITIEGGRLTPEALWAMGRINSVHPDEQSGRIAYTISYYSVEENRSTSWIRVCQHTSSPDSLSPNSLKTIDEFVGHSPAWHKGELCYINADGQVVIGDKILTGFEHDIEGFLLSPEGDKIILIAQVKTIPSTADKYPDLPLASGRVVDDLMYKHWDEWTETAPHPFLCDLKTPLGKLTSKRGKLEINNCIDLLENTPYESPLKPFGGTEQLAWSPDSKYIAYACRKKIGRDYAISTDSDIYLYNVENGETQNLCKSADFKQPEVNPSKSMQFQDINQGKYLDENMGYDNNPSFSPDGNKIAWTSMQRDGYEADRNRLCIYDLKDKTKTYATEKFDSNVDAFCWGENNKTIFFIGVWHGCVNLYKTNIEGEIVQLTDDQMDFGSLQLFPSEKKNKTALLMTRHSMSQADELYIVTPGKNKESTTICQLTNENTDFYQQLEFGKVEPRWTKTTDNKNLLSWIILPPGFDPNKKYPTLLFCEGGPQSPVSQFWSYRWNFQIMAAHGYIIVAPNRRGLPGFGSKWNEDISGDWTGQCMKDYLSAIDDACTLPFVDKDRLGCVGASFGGFSVYYLAGHHDKRFKAFIAHDGAFNLESMYTDTEEAWFSNWEYDDAYWNKDKSDRARKTYENSPHRFVDKWDTPILCIHGELDYRINANQGFGAFNAARLKGIPAQLLIYPDENHWVLKPQNGVLWQRTFFSWLDRWLK